MFRGWVYLVFVDFLGLGLRGGLCFPGIVVGGLSFVARWGGFC